MWQLQAGAPLRLIDSEEIPCTDGKMDSALCNPYTVRSDAELHECIERESKDGRVLLPADVARRHNHQMSVKEQEVSDNAHILDESEVSPEAL